MSLYAHTCRELIADHQSPSCHWELWFSGLTSARGGNYPFPLVPHHLSSRGRQRQSESGNRASSTPREREGSQVWSRSGSG